MLTTRSCHLCARGSFIFKRARPRGMRANRPAGPRTSQVSSYPDAWSRVDAMHFRLHSDWRSRERVRIEKKESNHPAKARTPCVLFSGSVGFSGPVVAECCCAAMARAGGRVRALGARLCASHDRSATTAPLGRAARSRPAAGRRRAARVFSENRARRLRASFHRPSPFCHWRCLYSCGSLDGAR